MTNIRMSRNVAHIENLIKQQVSPSLALFFKELTTALEDEYGNMAKAAYLLLRMFSDWRTHNLLTISKSKGHKIKEDLTFTSIEHIRLKCFRDISNWLLNDWHPFVKELPMSRLVPIGDDISS